MTRSTPARSTSLLGVKFAPAFAGRLDSMVEVVVASPAEFELSEALRWYAERSLATAERFDEEFDHSLRIIASAPDRFAMCDDRHRFFLMRRFPYQIIYRHDAANLTVIAVADTSREPTYWHGR